MNRAPSLHPGRSPETVPCICRAPLLEAQQLMRTEAHVMGGRSA